jgi:DNA-binding response OmpR family regulator
MPRADPWHDVPLPEQSGRKGFPVCARGRQKNSRGINRMAQSRERILVVDDDRDLCELLDEYLTREGFRIETVYDGETGLAKALAGSYGVVILDVMLPGRRDGFDVLQRMRSQIGTPVLMLTARGEDLDRIIGLEMGADDYLPKPFNPRELVARLHAILRRANSGLGRAATGLATVRCKVGDLEMAKGERRVWQDGRPIELTTAEFDLLEMLLLRVGYIVTREELSESVLGRSPTPYDRSIDVHVSKLRKKLGRDPNGAEMIKSIRGSGYIYVLPGAARPKG